MSGGLDSMVCAGLAREGGIFSRRADCQLQSAAPGRAGCGATLSRHSLAERHIVLSLDLRAFGGSALTGDIAVPKDGVGEGIPVTYVPARNTIFFGSRSGWPRRCGARDIFIGVNALDYSGYPDCRPEFIAAFEKLANLATKAGVDGARFTIHAPLQHMTKADIAREARGSASTPGSATAATTLSPDGRACGECDACRLRAKGFAEAGLADPTVYA